MNRHLSSLSSSSSGITRQSKVHVAWLGLRSFLSWVTKRSFGSEWVSPRQQHFRQTLLIAMWPVRIWPWKAEHHLRSIHRSPLVWRKLPLLTSTLTSYRTGFDWDVLKNWSYVKEDFTSIRGPLQAGCSVKKLVQKWIFLAKTKIWR